MNMEILNIIYDIVRILAGVVLIYQIIMCYKNDKKIDILERHIAYLERKIEEQNKTN